MKMATKKVTKSQASSKNVIENKACKAQVLKNYNERAADRLAHHSDGAAAPQHAAARQEGPAGDDHRRGGVVL